MEDPANRAARPASVDSRQQPGGSELRVGMLGRNYTGRELALALVRKFSRKFLPRDPGLQPVVSFNGLAVFDQPELQRGGLVDAAAFQRVLLQYGVRACERALDFGAGAGYIGFALLAYGFCRQLSLCDCDENCLSAMRRTVEYNRLQELVSVYRTDVLCGIPAGEKWDLVCSIPPCRCQGPGPDWDLDPDWKLHREFYSGVKAHMIPGALMVTMHHRAHSDVTTFAPMIEAGGGRVLGHWPVTDFRGVPGLTYFILSGW